MWLQMVATVCMFLAGKVEETPRPLREVIMFSYEIRFKKDPVAVQKIRQKVVLSLAIPFGALVGQFGVTYFVSLLLIWSSSWNWNCIC